MYFYCRHLTDEFPDLILYTEMLKLMQNVLVPFSFYRAIVISDVWVGNNAV